jgi:Tol biopolymer transport system component
MKVVGFLLLTATALACTRPNPSYCDEDVPCETGVCDLPTHSCVEPDAPTTDAPTVDAGPDGCAVAGGQIVFTTNRDGDREIARMWADGSGLVFLTQNTWPDEAPVFSPDGSMVAWFDRPTGAIRLSVMSSDGSNPRTVDDGAGFSSRVRWSPDGTQLLYSAMRNGNEDVFRANADGSSVPARLTTDPADDQEPDWSPDGSEIVFWTSRETTGLPIFGDLYVMDAGGGNQHAITSVTDLYTEPMWSPGGALILHTRSTKAIQFELWTINLGLSVRDLQVSGVQEYLWSPSGTRIVYSTLSDVFTISSTGTENVNLTDGQGTANSGAAWSPSGDQIVFQSNRTGDSEVFAVAADGAGEAVNLTNDPGSDSEASWAACSL